MTIILFWACICMVGSFCWSPFFFVAGWFGWSQKKSNLDTWYTEFKTPKTFNNLFHKVNNGTSGSADAI